jgi:putative oxidoreductase
MLHQSRVPQVRRVFVFAPNLGSFSNEYQTIGKEKMRKLSDLIAAAYEALCLVLNALRTPLLLAIRLYWGWQFATDGWEKLTHLDRVTDFFTTLGLPAPGMTALMVACIEFAGGILFAAGIASRLVSLVLFVNMTMAYLSVSDDRVNFSHIFSKPEDFYGAGPYTYWFAALLILLLGPGLFAVDTLIARRYARTSRD